MMTQLTVAQLAGGLDRLLDRLMPDTPAVAAVVADSGPALIDLIKRVDRERDGTEDGVAAIFQTDKGDEVTLSLFIDGRWTVVFPVGVSGRRCVEVLASGTVSSVEVGAEGQLSVEVEP